MEQTGYHNKINMKTLILIISLFLCLSATAQKKDTTIQITVTLDQFRALIYTIDQNIDSKKVSREILSFLQSNAQIVADKPKEVKPKQ